MIANDAVAERTAPVLQGTAWFSPVRSTRMGMGGKIWILAAQAAFLLLYPVASLAQSSSATLAGTVVDSTGSVVVGASLELVNLNTSVRRDARTEADGTFVITSLPPSDYSLRISLDGFAPSLITPIALRVDDRIRIRVELAPAAHAEDVTVSAHASQSSHSPSLSTVVDRKFVENLPLNGRSLQSLLELTPGVVLTKVGGVENGQFSVNGQRQGANYFLVDGVSGNVGIAGGTGIAAGQSGSGQLPALTSLGGTNGMVSVDALQEFRIHTSTYAPEFGRTPGGQISLVTRSGTNEVHGSLFDYFRDESLDANDWFTNNKGLPKPELYQHSFGGVVGGPVLPRRMFFFGSYEGLRLKQPRTRVVFVPTIAIRQSSLPAYQPFLNALPLPNGSAVGDFAEFSASFSDPSRLNSVSGRLDVNAARGLTFFTRLSRSSSYTRRRTGTLSQVDTANQDSTSVTAGVTWMQSPSLIHDLRINYSSSEAPYVLEPDSFGGAVPLDASIFAPGLNASNSLIAFVLSGGGSIFWGTGSDFLQRQANIVQSLTLIRASHEIKLGSDFRRISPSLRYGFTNHQYVFGVSDLSTGRARSFINRVRDDADRDVIFDNISLYAQDTWRAGSRVTVTYGLRWEFVPPARSTGGRNAITLDNIDVPYGGNVSVGAPDAPLWNTRYNNLAPRLGLSYVLSDAPSSKTVLKAGGGVFFDLGFGQIASTYSQYPFVAQKTISNGSFPVSAAGIAPPQLVVDPPTQVVVMDPNVKLPYTYQWNVTLDRTVGSHQNISLAYVGASGHRLMSLDHYSIPIRQWPTVMTSVDVNRNSGYSDYRALQLQYQRRLHDGLQAMASYTFGQSRDTSSSDFTYVPAELLPPKINYGYSDYDVRHVVTAAATYQLPTSRRLQFIGTLLRDTSIDVMFRARTGFPINVLANGQFPLVSEELRSVRPNVVPNQPFWLEDSTKPGGRYLNRKAFVEPAVGSQGDLARGVVRGFSARQVDVALRRDVRLRSYLRLQLRLEVFNVLNVPNFSDPAGGLSNSAGFGIATQTLGQGLGGLNALYQIGGPRASQLAVKAMF